MALPSASHDLQQSAQGAGLRYVNSEESWYTRKPKAKGFIYTDADGRLLKGHAWQQRLLSLIIPPAWQEVRICPHPHGHLQAVGRDSKGRKQYIYHPKWRDRRNLTKFHRLVEFGQALSKIRQTIDRNLRKPGLCKEKVLAIAVRLLEETHMRIGNTEYACTNGTYGLTTLKAKHLKVTGRHLHFSFKGKSGKAWTVDIDDKRLAPVLRACQELPGQELFHYVDADGGVHTISSDDVNNYLKAATGQDFSAKDFRTWQGTVEALKAFSRCEVCASRAKRQRLLAGIHKQVAQVLVNTPAICRKYYIHPEITQAYLDGSLYQAIEQAKKQTRRGPYALSSDEQAVLLVLKRTLKRNF